MINLSEQPSGASRPAAVMSRGQAVRCTESIRKKLRDIDRDIGEVRALLLDFHRGDGWRAMNYASWQAWATEEFGQSKTQMYRQLQAAQFLADQFPLGEFSSLPERTLRPVVSQPAGVKTFVAENIKADPSPPTAARIQELTAKAIASLSPEDQLRVVQDEAERVRQEHDDLEQERARVKLQGAVPVYSSLKALARKMLERAKKGHKKLIAHDRVAYLRLGRQVLKHSEAILSGIGVVLGNEASKKRKAG